MIEKKSKKTDLSKIKAEVIDLKKIGAESISYA